MNPARFRVARPTDDLERLHAFYVRGLGLEVRGTFVGHDGYDGLILATPDASYEIEFTRHVDGSPCPAPTRDNLLVFYLAGAAQVERVAASMRDIGCAPVAPENTYWVSRGLTFEDPDGWRVVVADGEAMRAARS